MKITPIEEGNYYHIYNRGNNGINLFYEKENYLHFLRLYEKYIDPVTETIAWVLLKNHFHLLVYIKFQTEIDANLLSYSTVEKPKEINVSKQFSNLFNAYTQSMNKRYKRTGSLFEKPFRRKLISNDKYFQNMIYYIHNNPVKHGFVDDMIDYPWSSYASVLSTGKTRLHRKKVLDIFTNAANFVNYHSSIQNMDNIDDLIMD